MTRWRKSSFSDVNTNCVEVALDAVRVGVRDSKSPSRSLTFPTSAWRSFITR